MYVLYGYQTCEHSVGPASPLWWIPTMLWYKLFSLIGVGFNGYLLVGMYVHYPPPLNHFLFWVPLLVSVMLSRGLGRVIGRGGRGIKATQCPCRGCICIEKVNKIPISNYLYAHSFDNSGLCAPYLLVRVFVLYSFCYFFTTLLNRASPIISLSTLLWYNVFSLRALS